MVERSPGIFWTSTPRSTADGISKERLLELAEFADAGFDRMMFASALGALDQISDAAFAAYRVDASAVRALRRRFAAWRHELNQ